MRVVLGVGDVSDEFPDDPTAKQVEFIVALVRQMSVADRKRLLDDLGGEVCLLCGEDAPCYCAPGFDE